MYVGKILPLMQFPILLFFLVLQQCLQAACSNTLRMSTRRKVEVFKDTPLPDTPLIFSIQTLPSPLHTNTRSSSPIPTSTPLSAFISLHCLISPSSISLFYASLPPTLLSSSSFWLFFVITSSTTFSSSSSWEVAQNPFKCCKSKSIYHNHLSLTVHISYAILKDTLTHTYCRKKYHVYLHCTRKTSACAVSEWISK